MLTLKQMQRSQPWRVPYSWHFESAASAYLPHLHAAHAVMHAMKTLGKLAAVFEALDHRHSPVATPTEIETVKAMSADMVTMALRLANLYQFDLEAELCQRVEEKNGVGFRTE